MKRILIGLLILIPVFCMAQSDPEQILMQREMEAKEKKENGKKKITISSRNILMGVLKLFLNP